MCTFVRCVCVWYLRQAISGAFICAELKIPVAEYAAIRERFYTYDNRMSGEMAASDLAYLLLDMGGEYNEKQLELVAAMVDGDGLGVVDLADFILWWVGMPIPNSAAMGFVRRISSSPSPVVVQ